MASSIFRLDWILIDSVIILLLLFVLIGVKFFKEGSRWRSALSNKSLEIIHYKKSDFKGKIHNNAIKDFTFIRNSITKKEEYQYPLIILCKTRKNRKIAYIIAEGLASYGCNVVFPQKNTHFFSNKDIISSFITFFNQNNLISNSTYFIIKLSKDIPYLTIKSDSNNRGLLLINPKFNKEVIEMFSEISDFKSQLFYVFSRKLNFLMKNQNLKKFKESKMKQNPNNMEIFTINKAKSSFKYYETILLGIIIKIINKISLKS